jgi:hypothetical protein
MILRVGYPARQQSGARNRQRGSEDGEHHQKSTTTEIAVYVTGHIAPPCELS